MGTSSVSPAGVSQFAELHAAHGSYYVAGPVVGGPNVAEAGELISFLAGDADAIARCAHLFDAYTKMVLNVGTEPRIANAVKICVNYMAASVIELTGQVCTFGEKCGIGASYLTMMMKTMFPQPQLQEYAERIQARDFEPAGFAGEILNDCKRRWPGARVRHLDEGELDQDVRQVRLRAACRDRHQ